MSSLSEAQGVSPCFKDAAEFFFFLKVTSW